MAAHPQNWISPEQYLEIERDAEFRHEYYNGRIYAMAGRSPRHAIIIANLVGEFPGLLKKSPCFVASSDFRVAASGRLYTYPDVVVACGEHKYVGDRQDTLSNPRLVIEVLSPSTESKDRGMKFTEYRKIESLQEYAVVSQEEAKVEIFRCQDGGRWLMTEYSGRGAVARFESIEASVPLAEIYAKVQFGEEGA